MSRTFPGGRSRFTLSSLPATDFPVIEEINAQQTLTLEQGKPLLFGPTNRLGIKLDGFTPKVVNLNEGHSANDLWIHDEKDIYKAQILVRIFDDPKIEGHLPRPFGVFYQTDRPCYEETMNLQMQDAKARKAADLDKLLKGSEVWTIA